MEFNIFKTNEDGSGSLVQEVTGQLLDIQGAVNNLDMSQNYFVIAIIIPDRITETICTVINGVQNWVPLQGGS